MLRLDRIHPLVSGNKWFKLKYNLEAAAGKPVVTFGGAWSNHILATAAACKMEGIPCTGIIRGERPAVLSHTLQQAAALGMELVFVSREAYRHKDASAFPDACVIPEGGHNAAGARGCSEILSLADTKGFTHIICAVGTGTTLAGLINATDGENNARRPGLPAAEIDPPAQKIIGISVLKGAYSLEEDTAQLLTQPGRPEIFHDFHEGGYGKISDELIACMNDFYRQTGIPTDRVYTGKMVLAVNKLLERSYFPPGSRLLLVHSGGLQGNDSLPPGVLCF